MKKFLSILMALAFCGVLGTVAFAADEDAASQVKSLQEQQQRLLDEYELDKKNLQASINEALQNYSSDSPDDKVNRINLMKKAQKDQETLRIAFEEKLTALQRQERKLRTGREEVNGMPAYTEATKQYYQQLEEKKQRQEMLERSRRVESPAANSALPAAAKENTANPSSSAPASNLPEISTRAVSKDTPERDADAEFNEVLKKRYPNRVNTMDLRSTPGSGISTSNGVFGSR